MTLSPRFLVILLVAAMATCVHGANPSLPKVLIIGDSISLGYTPFVTELLQGTAIVEHNKGNAGPTQRGLENIDSWLEGSDYDVIHFNWGLWDMYHWRYWEVDQTPASYGRNLEKLVQKLENTGAKLIWATTTPPCEVGEMKQQVYVDAATEKKYLAAARRVMRRHKIQVNDLNAFMRPLRAMYSKGPNDVHYTKPGYRVLAEQVAEKIEEALGE